jgi:uncharacterized protein
MFDRPFWRQRIEKAWRRRSVVWLSGVRRAGKTSLGRSLENVEYFDCELPRVRRSMEDPEAFLAGLRGRRVVLDEVHRLLDPSELLKIAADHFPDVPILATGSSTLGASARFRDTLTGRRTDLWLTPMNLEDLAAFGQPDLVHRLRRGGLPPFFLATEPVEADFQDWIDSYWAKDVLELFRLERRTSFQRFLELLFAQSGGIFEATRFARPCEVSRTTIANYLAVLEATYVVHVLRPFSQHSASEIVAAPKVYGFDTGFVSYYRGLGELRPEDRGLLWEHFVLNELHGRVSRQALRYWRSKHGNEIDLVVVQPGKPPLAIECKWSASDFDAANLRVFRQRYPESRLVVVAADVERTFVKRYQGLEVQFVGLGDLGKEVEASGPETN